MKKSVFILLLLTSISFSQSKELVQRLDSVTNFIDEQLNIKPGTSIIVTKNNKTLYTASNGLSSIELNTKNTINTMYDLASIAKMFTGYAIATLEVEGKLSMDDDIRTYLKDFPEYDHKITIGHLVHHTSGIKNWTYLINEMGWSSEDKISTDQLLRAIYAQKHLDFVPGDRYQYCNSGYVLLTKIIEEVTNQSFVNWTDEYIFKPLGMNSTFFNEDQNKVIEGMASAYMLDNDGNRIREAYNTSALGSSSLISNATDMGKWMNFLLFPTKDKKGIVDKMFTTTKLNNGDANNYAYGIEIEEFNDHKVIGHDGSWSSFTSYMTIVPELNVGLFFANNYRVGTGQIRDLYLEVFFPKEKEANTNSKEEKNNAKENSTEPEKEVVIPTEQLDKYTGIYKLCEAWYLDIMKKGKDLYTQANGENAFYMKPVNDSTFIVRAYGNRTITFITNKKGKVDKLVYNDITANRKTTPFYFNEEAFKKYEGVYYSTELGVLYSIEVNRDEMLYKNIKTGNFELIYENDKLFFSDGKLSKITFEYNDENQITGFYKINWEKKKLYYFNKAN
ncbi:serine hydrolase [uncultured Winogradskyella sp.]|uniref:serine hydrolase n=1 Tax=uncultured Winogradskyella sp. TaxID=395353 RepID=UPI0026110861|nr:serine hydrolase [uncultured Winogradskyella sp.]